jgi:hypothetical protein
MQVSTIAKHTECKYNSKVQRTVFLFYAIPKDEEREERENKLDRLISKKVACQDLYHIARAASNVRWSTVGQTISKRNLSQTSLTIRVKLQLPIYEVFL